MATPGLVSAPWNHVDSQSLNPFRNGFLSSLAESITPRPSARSRRAPELATNPLRCGEAPVGPDTRGKMKPLISHEPVRRCPIRKQGLPRSGVATCCNIRHCNCAPSKIARAHASLIECRAPFSQTTFPAIYLLTTTDERDNYSPIRVSLHNLQKESRFRL